MPENRISIMRGLEERLIVEELNIWTNERLGNIEYGIVVNKFPIVQIALTHLHDLQHLCGRVVLRTEIIGIANGEIAKAVILPRGCKFAVVFPAQYLDVFILEKFANREIAILKKNSTCSEVNADIVCS